MRKKAAKGKNTQQDLTKRASEIIKRLRRAYPAAKTALYHGSPFELLVATILSAQCTDERVNKVAPDLFRRFPGAADLAGADIHELESIIRSTGFFRAKAKNIINCCRALMERHSGGVPDSMEELVKLPGVGRKTANVVLGNFFGIATGIVVDTHVKRLAGRMGLSSQTDPVKIEKDLMSVVAKKDWIDTGNIFIWHGREICAARKPKCPQCQINDICPSAQL